MPFVESRFQPPRVLQNGHVQTILPVLLPRRLNVPFVRERLELKDGDFLDLDWLKSGRKRLAILSHGLEGNSTQSYIQGMALALQTSGWDVLAWNFRGCSEELNRVKHFYHSGETKDLGVVIEHAAQTYDEITLVGFSLGGNITLKYLGEAAPHAAVKSAAVISTPLDLAASAKALDERRSNSIYLRRFLTSLIAKMEAKAVKFPEHLQTSGIRKIRSFQVFDDRFTAPLHGFRDAADYWEKSSSRQFLRNVSVPTLILNALNDPFLTPESFPYEEAEANAFLFLETPASGGHVGFLDDLAKRHPWSEKRVVEFLAATRLHAGRGI